MQPSSSRKLYLLVLFGIILGVVLGAVAPDFAVQLKPFGDGFISLLKMVIAPVIFCTIALGIAEAGSLRDVGRLGLKTIVYFEVISTLSLILGLVVVNVFKPGASFHVDPATLDPNAMADYVAKAHEQKFSDFILHLIPKTILDAFVGSGDLLQVLLVAILFGIALNQLKGKVEPVQNGLRALSEVLFRIVGMIMKLAPLGAGGAMAYTVGKYGLESLKPLASLMLCFYATCLIFVFVILGLIAKVYGFSIWRFVRYLRGEILTVLATSSSESVLVPLMQKLENLGCPKSVVGLVVPTGYSFNLDGTNIYLTMAALFVVQALGIELTLAEQLSLLLVAVLTSKGASGVTGAGFITLAATLAVVPKVPVAGLTLILGIDRFMSEARAMTNMIGNGVASVVLSRSEGRLDIERLRKVLNGEFV